MKELKKFVMISKDWDFSKPVSYTHWVLYYVPLYNPI